MDHIDEVDHIDQLYPKTMLSTLSVSFLGSSAELERGDANCKGGYASGRVCIVRKRLRRKMDVLGPFVAVLGLLVCVIEFSSTRSTFW